MCCFNMLIFDFYGYMMIGYKIECIVGFLFFLIIEKRIYYLWTKTFGSDGHTHIPTTNISQSIVSKDPETHKSSVFQKSEKKWKKIAKTPLFFKHFQKIEIIFHLSQIHHLLSYS